MATVNFSVPNDIKEDFNKAFAGENKSAVIAGLMRQAVEERRRRKRRSTAIREILELRNQHRPASTREIVAARRADRP